MVNSASSLASSCAAASPLKRLEAREGCERSLEALFTLFCGGGLRRESVLIALCQSVQEQGRLLSCGLFSFLNKINMRGLLPDVMLAISH